MRRAVHRIIWCLERGVIRQTDRIMSTVPDVADRTVASGQKCSSPHPPSPPPPSARPPAARSAGIKAQLLYRRPLPEKCIAFASDEGKTIFKEALGTGHMSCYFRLASQFRTQDEPAYCGLATLIMVLNALEIDPGRVWKGPWKWYHEDMLDCCVSKEIIRKEGITFDEFICLADCNYLDTEAMRVDASSKEDNFRSLVRSMTLKEESFLVVSYSRQTLEQTGDGHFAPVSGYHPERDLVLILDTARFKYPPHWVPLPQLFEAMKRLDKSTGLPRGYIQLWPAKNTKTLLLFKISEQFSVNASPQSVENFERFIAAWSQQLTGSLSSGESPPLSAVVRQAFQGLVRTAGMLDQKPVVLRTQEHISCTHACNLQCIVKELISELQDTGLFRAVCQEVMSMPRHEVEQLEGLFGMWPSVLKAEQGVLDAGGKDGGEQQCCDMHQYLCLCDFLTAFLLSWPYPAPASHSCSSVGSGLEMWSESTLQGSTSQVLKDEMTTLHHQLKKLAGFHTSCCAQETQSGCHHKQKPATRSKCCSEKQK